MKRFAIVVAGLAALVVLVASLGTSAASRSRGQTHFTVVTHDSQGTITPPSFGANPKQNDQASEDAPAFRGDHKVGRAETVVTITRVAPNDLEAMIECTVELRQGNVMFNGAFNFNEIANGVSVPVVGGTGRYAGARGTVQLKSTNPARTRLTFDFATS
jgi:hypothetical protein